MRNIKNDGKCRGGRGEGGGDTCEHGLSRRSLRGKISHEVSWRVNVIIKRKGPRQTLAWLDSTIHSFRRAMNWLTIILAKTLASFVAGWVLQLVLGL